MSEAGNAIEIKINSMSTTKLKEETRERQETQRQQTKNKTKLKGTSDLF